MSAPCAFDDLPYHSEVPWGGRVVREKCVVILEGPSPRRDSWETTRWSVIGRLDQRDAPVWETCWAYLIETYRKPMEKHAYRVLSRVRPQSATLDEAEEIVNGFLATCFEKDWLRRADPLRGKFRAYVQTLLRRYVYSCVRKQSAKKRTPEEGLQQGILDHDAADETDPAVRAENEEFDRSWVKVAVDRALGRLRDEQERYLVVIQDLIATHGEGSADLGERVGLRRAQVAVLRHRARQRFLRLFEEEMSATVGDEVAFEEEWRALQPYLP